MSEASLETLITTVPQPGTVSGSSARRPRRGPVPASRFVAWSVALHAALLLGFATVRIAESVAARPATVVASFDDVAALPPDPVEPPPAFDAPVRPSDDVACDEPPPLVADFVPDAEFTDVRSVISVTDRLAKTPRTVGRRRAPVTAGGDGTGGGTGTGAPADDRAATIAPAPTPPAPPPVVERTPLRVVSAPHPAYPESARSAHVEGTVLIEVDVLDDGSVGDVRVVESSGSRMLDDAAVRAVRRWRFAPETIDGVPQRATVRLPAIRFRLDR